MTNMADDNGAKGKEAARSVIETPEASGTNLPSAAGTFFWQVADLADEIAPWGTAPKLRDRQLRDFITKESIFASGLGGVCASNAGLRWTVDGAPRTAQAAKDILENADQGRGWESFTTKLSFDLYSQNHGAFIETVRSVDTPDSPVVALNHLDAEQCYHTGDPLRPVIYLDRRRRYHLLDRKSTRLNSSH